MYNEYVSDIERARQIQAIKEPQKLNQVPRLFCCYHYKPQTEDPSKCCYIHQGGLPEKNGKKHPFYAYEKSLEDDYRKHQFLAILKATGLGITEFFLLMGEHESLTNPLFANAQIPIFTGPNRDLAKLQIARIRNHLLKRQIPFEGDAYNLKLNSTQIMAIPSMNIDAGRSLTNPQLILVDEASFFGMTKDEEVRAVVERYIPKSNPKIVFYSTPGLPEGFFFDLMREEPNPYKKIYLPYHVGLQVHPESLTSIYDHNELEVAKQSPHFPREMELQWGYGFGNIFPYQLLDLCVEEYDLVPQSKTRCLFYDPGFGSSKFGIVGMEKREDGNLYILDGEQFDRASFPAMVERLKILTKSKYDQVFGDNSRPEIVRELQSNGIDAHGVIFSKELTEMTISASQKVKERKVRIHPVFRELLLQLRSVEYNEKGHPDKKKLTFDLGDPFMMGCKYFSVSFYGKKLKDAW